MQINFKAKKLKEANKYVNLLNPPLVEEIEKVEQKKRISFVQKLLNILFK